MSTQTMALFNGNLRVVYVSYVAIGRLVTRISNLWEERWSTWWKQDAVQAMQEAASVRKLEADPAAGVCPRT